jgi:hypothetical protein
MVEPPGNLGRGRILKVHNGVLVASELGLIEERSGAVEQANVLEGSVVANALQVETREQSCRCCAIKTFVVEEDPDLQK